MQDAAMMQQIVTGLKDYWNVDKDPAEATSFHEWLELVEYRAADACKRAREVIIELEKSATGDEPVDTVARDTAIGTSFQPLNNYAHHLAAAKAADIITYGYTFITEVVSMWPGNLQGEQRTACTDLCRQMLECDRKILKALQLQAQVSCGNLHNMPETAAAAREVLRRNLDGMPEGDFLGLLGDYDARNVFEQYLEKAPGSPEEGWSDSDELDRLATMITRLLGEYQIQMSRDRTDILQKAAQFTIQDPVASGFLDRLLITDQFLTAALIAKNHGPNAASGYAENIARSMSGTRLN